MSVFRLPPRPLSLISLSLGLLMTASCALVGDQLDGAWPYSPQPADSAISVQTRTRESVAASADADGRPGALKLTPGEAVLLCLENNRALRVQRLNPSLQQTVEDQERALFDPRLEAQVAAGRIKGERLARSGSDTEPFTTDTVQGVIALEQYFPTGTSLTLAAEADSEDASLYSDTFYSNRLGLSATQALLRGFGRDVNLARMRQARLETRMSEYELRGFTESLVAEVEGMYWEYALSRRQVEIVEESLKVARLQLQETRELIEVGRLAKVELAAVQAEVASQQQALIEARAAQASIRLNLLHLLNLGGAGSWQREIELVHRPTLPDVKLEDVAGHVRAALRMRPLLNQARLEVLRDDLELVRTKNGLLPLLDLFITLGKSAYADAFGEALNLADASAFDAEAGIRFSYPLRNRDARARHRRGLLSRQQSQEALANLSQLVEVEVRQAYIEVERTRQQISASSATRAFDEQKLHTETEKLRVGKSTSFLVAQAQRDLLVSRIAEVRALANHLRALINLYRLDGSLLVRRGIDAPGRREAEQAAAAQPPPEQAP